METNNDKVIEVLIGNVDHFNITAVAKWCKIERSRMQRCISGNNKFHQTEIQSIKSYFKQLKNVLTQVCD